MCDVTSNSVQAWRPLLEAHADFGDPSRDVDRLLAWIAEESCGNAGSLGSQYEVGIFQIDLEDGPAWGASVQSLHGAFTSSPTSQVLTRPLTDDEKLLQVTSGLAYVAHVRNVSQTQLASAGLTWSDDDTWCLTKLQHGLPAIPGELLAQAAQNAPLGTGIGWQEFRAYVQGLATSDLPANLKPYAYKFDQIFNNAERVGYLDGPDGGGTTSTLLALGALLLLWIFLR